MDDVELWDPSCWDGNLSSPMTEPLGSALFDDLTPTEASQWMQLEGSTITNGPYTNSVLSTDQQHWSAGQRLPYAEHQPLPSVEYHSTGESQHWSLPIATSIHSCDWSHFVAAQSDSGYSTSHRSSSIGIPSELESDSGNATGSPIPRSCSAEEEQASADAGESNYKCDFPGCRTRTRFRRPCDLRKHQKRHCKSFFCRFPDCARTTSKGLACIKDRDRHEARHDPSIPCAWPGCRRVFSRVDNMVGSTASSLHNSVLTVRFQKDHARRIHRMEGR